MPFTSKGKNKWVNYTNAAKFKLQQVSYTSFPFPIGSSITLLSSNKKKYKVKPQSKKEERINFITTQKYYYFYDQI
jgi:hypothetical protein